MSALNAPMTLPTTADVDVELAVDRLSWDLDLILVIDMGWLDRTPTVGAGIGQERLVDFVDLFGGRWLAVGLGAAVLARLTCPSGGSRSCLAPSAAAAR